MIVLRPAGICTQLPSDNPGVTSAQAEDGVDVAADLAVLAGREPQEPDPAVDGDGGELPGEGEDGSVGGQQGSVCQAGSSGARRGLAGG